MSSNNPRFSFNGDGKHPKPQAYQRKKQVIEALNKRFKELNKFWDDAEADLKQVPILVDVSLCYKSVPANPFDYSLGETEAIHDHIGFVKSEGGWRICHGQSHDGFPNVAINWEPIAERSLELRWEAVPHAGELRELVLKAAEECVSKFDAAVANLRSAMRSG